MKQKQEYKWSYPGFARYVSARRVHLELVQIKKEKGRCTPQDILERAKNPDSAMHCIEKFYWNDDSKAAQKYREYVARCILGGIRTVTIYEDGHTKERRTWLSFSPIEGKNAGYGLFTEVTSVDANELVLERAKRDLFNWYNRYSEIAEAYGQLFGEIERFLKLKKERRSRKIRK